MGVGFSPRKVNAPALGSLILVLVLAGVLWFMVPGRPPTGVIRIGFQNARPFHFPDAAGKPSGPVVEVIEEAARRGGVHLEWIFSPGGAEKSIQSGRVDLWPIFGDIPERRKMFYISEPWLQIGYAVATQEGRGSSIQDLAGRILAVSTMSMDRRYSKRHFAWSRQITRNSQGELLAAVCRGEADAALIKQTAAWIAMPPECQNIRLSVERLNQGPLWYGLGALRSQPRAIAAADRIRAEISRLAREGQLSSIDLRWSFNATNEVRILDEFKQAQQRTWWMIGTSTVLAMVLVLLISQRRKLRAARSQAEAASRAKGDFLANMSHEIRTPMNGILGMADLAIDTEPGEEQREYLHMVKTCAQSLLIVINDILDFSKIEAGRMDLEAIEFDLSAILHDVTDLIAVRAREKGLEVGCSISAEVPDKIIGDPTRLRQILVNLMGNAVKFTARGEVGVGASVESRTSGAVCLHFKIHDTGIGISKDAQQKIFEAFTQADTSTTREHGGTGLGLSITSRLVALMQGRIWLESEAAKGSTFHFTAHFEVPAHRPAMPLQPVELGEPVHANK